ncbi:hypothetical protein Ciccas_006894, partial [Cichlidogyrus casuarinus]
MSKKDAQAKKSAITEMETDKLQQSTPRAQSTGRTVKPSLRDVPKANLKNVEYWLKRLDDFFECHLILNPVEQKRYLRASIEDIANEQLMKLDAIFDRGVSWHEIKEDVQKHFLPDPMEREIRQIGRLANPDLSPREKWTEMQKIFPDEPSRRTFWLISMGLEESMKLKLRTHKENPSIDELIAIAESEFKIRQIEKASREASGHTVAAIRDVNPKPGNKGAQSPSVCQKGDSYKKADSKGTGKKVTLHRITYSGREMLVCRIHAIFRQKARYCEQEGMCEFQKLFPKE